MRAVGPSCIKIIEWKVYGVYLVIAGDPNMIGNRWLGFVPIEQTFEVEEL